MRHLDLFRLLEARAARRGSFLLTSGRMSDFYLDCKRVTLTGRGHELVGAAVWEAIATWEGRRGKRVAAVGGLTLGADPIVSATLMRAAAQGRDLAGILVRKEPKAHGTHSVLEGADNAPPRSEVVVVEDVTTTGGSAAQAVGKLRAAGFHVGLVVTLVDRCEGGREHLVEQHGVEVVALFDRRDFLPTLGSADPVPGGLATSSHDGGAKP